MSPDPRRGYALSTHIGRAPAQRPAQEVPRRWTALAGVATAQLMIGIDSTIMNIALPSTQQALHLSDPARQWVITAFTLCYGGLLLLGGRLSDLMGRRRALLLALAGFAAASALGGIAVNAGMFLGARAAQGVFGALLTPSVLATIAATFRLPAERARAYGVYGTVMGSSTGLGVLLGGVLTGYLSWRWCMLVNLPFALASALCVRSAVQSRPAVPRPRIDVTGAVLATGGLMALVLGFDRAQVKGWTAAVTVGSLTAGAVMVALFVAVQARSAQPLLPLRVLRHRRRGGSYLAVLALAAGMFSTLFFLTFHLQNVLGYSPVLAGLGFLPLTGGLLLGTRLATPLLARGRPRPALVAGLASAAVGELLLSLVYAGSGYLWPVLAVFVLIGLGAGAVLVSANSTATAGAGPDTAVAGAMVMTSQQIGASLGTALLGTIAGRAAGAHGATHDAVALVHGMNVAALTGTAVLVVATIAVAVVTGPSHDRPTDGPPAAVASH
ncbi:MAG TPA: MFS transporter [Kineosporiaceae bacterium]